MANSDMKAQIERQLVENDPGKTMRGLSLKVSEKKCRVSLWYWKRFPVTLYNEQWNKIPSVVKEIEFIKKNNDHLKIKE